jgi:hypothetical protein
VALRWAGKDEGPSARVGNLGLAGLFLTRPRLTPICVVNLGVTDEGTARPSLRAIVTLNLGVTDKGTAKPRLRTFPPPYLPI